MMSSFYNSYGLMGGAGFIFMAIFWILVILLIIYLIKLTSNSSRREDEALEILKKRFARGEISKEEFEEKKRELK